MSMQLRKAKSVNLCKEEIELTIELLVEPV